MARKHRTWSAELTVVGLQFRWKMDGRKVLAGAVPFPVDLEREPDNKSDADAIKVNLAGDFKLTKLKGMHLGYISNRLHESTGKRVGLASLLAPKLDNGSIEPVKLWVTEIDPEEGTAVLEARFRDLAPKRKTAGKKRKRTKRTKPLDNGGDYL